MQARKDNMPSRRNWLWPSCDPSQRVQPQQKQKQKVETSSTLSSDMHRLVLFLPREPLRNGASVKCLLPACNDGDDGDNWIVGPCRS
jgi:hypothetical protein